MPGSAVKKSKKIHEYYPISYSQTPQRISYKRFRLNANLAQNSSSCLKLGLVDPMGEQMSQDEQFQESNVPLTITPLKPDNVLYSGIKTRQQKKKSEKVPKVAMTRKATQLAAIANQKNQTLSPFLVTRCSNA